MKLLLGSDFHGSDRGEEELHWSLLVWEEFVKAAREHRADLAVVCGDILHVKYGMSARLLLQVNRILATAPCPILLVVGNHDLPWISALSDTVLELLTHARVMNEPTILVEQGILLAFQPWRPHKQFRVDLQALVDIARQHHGPRFLFSHVSLQEGHISPSQERLTVPLRAADLQPEVWWHSYLGDYHAHQTIDNITYLGAPRPRTHGDYDNKGFWLLDIHDQGWTIDLIPLSDRFPRYQTHQIWDEKDLRAVQFRPQDKVRIEVRMDLIPTVQARFPGAQVRPFPGGMVEVEQSRLGPVSNLDPIAILHRWLQVKGLEDPAYREWGERYLRCG